MKKVVFGIVCLVFIGNCACLQAQVYRNCVVHFMGTSKDSSSVSAITKEANIEINTQTGELILSLKLGSLITENSILAKELKEHNDKIYFKGNLGLEPNKSITQIAQDKNYPVMGYTRINGIRIPTKATYSVFQKSNSLGNAQAVLFNLDFFIHLSDFKIADYFPELMDEVKVSLVRQPLNLVE